MTQQRPVTSKGTLVGMGSDKPLPVNTWTGVPLDTAEPDNLVGQELSATYQILSVLGEGAMGRVYEAQHTRIKGKRFAIKVLHKELLRYKDIQVRFQREAEAAALINHPNVVGVYDVDDTVDGRPFLVVDLLEGEDLSSALERDFTMPIARAVPIIRQVCKALTAAHRQGVIHRDVKPENVFLTGDPEKPHVKVLDFGTSRLDDSASKITKTGTIIGTPGYMPPEQAKGERVDHRADVYGLGAILYHMLCGTMPFEKDGPGETLLAVLTEELIPPREIDPDIPVGLEQIVLKAMARSADARYQTADELDAALSAFDHPAAVGAPAPAGAAPLAPPALAGAVPPAAPALMGAVGTRPTLIDAPRTTLPDGADRPSLVALLSGAGAALFLGLHSGLTAIIRLALGDHDKRLGTAESVVVNLGVAVLVVAAVAFALRYFKGSGAWRDGVRARWLVDRAAPPLLIALAGYAVLLGLVRFFELSFIGQSVGLAWPVWDLLLPLLALAAGAVTAFADRVEALQKPAARVGLLVGGALLAALLIIVLVLVRGKLR